MSVDEALIVLNQLFYLSTMFGRQLCYIIKDATILLKAPFKDNPETPTDNQKPREHWPLIEE